MTEHQVSNEAMSEFIDNAVYQSIVAQLNGGQHRQRQQRWVVGFSGGIDSTVLLHSVSRINRTLATPLPLIAVHVNHQLSPSADVWQQRCESVAVSLGAQFFTMSTTVDNDGKGIESAARDARYAVFDHFLEEGDCLLLGHHHDDQAETVLLRLFRGAGVRGLSAIPSERVLGHGRLLRPLLDSSRQYIEAYAKQYMLTWVDDESNADIHFDRNFVRHRVLPELQQRWPAVTDTLTKTAQRMSQTEVLLEDLAQMDMASLGERPERLGVSIDFMRLRALLKASSSARINNVLRYWCRSSGHPVPHAEHLAQVMAQFFSPSALLSSACVTWKQTQLRQFNGRLYLSRCLADFSSPKPVIWDGEGDLDLGNAGRLTLSSFAPLPEEASPTVNAELSTHAAIVLPKANYTVAWRKGGERSTPSYRQHSQTVKKLLQEYQLETWLRDRVPLFFLGECLYAVGDLWVDQAALGHISQSEGEGADQETIVFRWEL